MSATCGIWNASSQSSASDQRRAIARGDEPLHREVAQRDVWIAEQLDERHRRDVAIDREPRRHHGRIGIEQGGRQQRRTGGALRSLDGNRAPRRAQERERALVRGRGDHLVADLEIARAQHGEHPDGGVAHAPERIGERRGQRGISSAPATAASA